MTTTILHGLYIGAICHSIWWLTLSLLVIIVPARRIVSNNSCIFIDKSIKISHTAHTKRSVNEFHSFLWRGVCKSLTCQIRDSQRLVQQFWTVSLCVWLSAIQLGIIWHILFFSVIYDFSILSDEKHLHFTVSTICFTVHVFEMNVRLNRHSTATMRSLLCLNQMENLVTFSPLWVNFYTFLFQFRTDSLNWAGNVDNLNIFNFSHFQNHDMFQQLSIRHGIFNLKITAFQHLIGLIKCESSFIWEEKMRGEKRTEEKKRKKI